jgi:hypothetical protein
VTARNKKEGEKKRKIPEILVRNAAATRFGSALSLVQARDSVEFRR